MHDAASKLQFLGLVQSVSALYSFLSEWHETMGGLGTWPGHVTTRVSGSWSSSHFLQSGLKINNPFKHSMERKKTHCKNAPLIIGKKTYMIYKKWLLPFLRFFQVDIKYVFYLLCWPLSWDSRLHCSTSWHSMSDLHFKILTSFLVCR